MHDLHNDLPFFSERMKVGKIKKFTANMHNKKGYVIHTKTLKQALNYQLILKKVHNVLISIKKLD